MNILLAALSLGGIGLVFGIILAVASKLLGVEVDDRQSQINEILPGANCGGCGFAGCSAFAGAVIRGEVSVSGCVAGGDEVTGKICAILGMEGVSRPKNVALIKCSGGDDILRKFDYVGIKSCFAATKVSGGPTECPFACIGYGDCVEACKFGAIKIHGNHAVVEQDLCVGCGSCVTACPRKLVELVPKNSSYFVGCSSKEKGGMTRNLCSVGCIGCGLCIKACEHDAITVSDNLAHIDQSKCIGCGKCASVCPRKIIKVSLAEHAQTMDKLSRNAADTI